MTEKFKILGSSLLVVFEIVLITILDYVKTDTYYSFDALYCLPVIQAASLSAIHATRRTDSQLPTIIAIAVAFIWSSVEVAIIWPDYPLNAFLFNIFTRSVTLTVIGRVVSKLWKEREYALKDALTNLGNRSEFLKRAETEQLRSQRSGHPYSILFIDIDNFKQMNDTLGHHIGDNALIKVAEILKENSRKIDALCRFGGDEFVVLFPETDEATCELLLKRIMHVAEQEFQQREWPISLSIGHVTERGKKRNVDDLLRDADKKMYSVKRDKL